LLRLWVCAASLVILFEYDFVRIEMSAEAHQLSTKRQGNLKWRANLMKLAGTH
jgi:hypothetical protein